MLRPPVGVALLGFLALMAGFVYLLVGFRYAGFVAFGPAELGSGLFLWGVLAIIAGVCFIAAAFALWATQPWGWLFAHILAILGVVEAIFIAIANNSVLDGFTAAIFPVLVLWYLNDRAVKEVFGIETPAQ